MHTTRDSAVPQAGTTPPGSAAAGAARWLLRALMAVSIVTAFIVLAVSTVPVLLGFRTLIVTSGSMTPAIKTGDAVLIHPVDPENILPGDVVTFPATYGRPGTITHRVTRVTRVSGQPYVQTKGDANEVTDPELTPAATVVGRVRFTLPKMGYLLSFACLAWGKALLIGFPLLVLTVQQVRSFKRGRAWGMRTVE